MKVPAKGCLPIPARRSMSRNVIFRATPAEAMAWRRQAVRDGKLWSVWIRDTLNGAL